jgi:hypothetical protein
LTASQQQTSALQNALGVQQGMFNTANAALSPYYTAGQNALPTLQSLLTPGPNQTATLSQLPGFQFAQNWGQQAVQNLGTTQGLSGNTLTAGANFATGLAQQNFGNLAGLLQNYVNTGAGAAGQLAGTAQGFGQQIGQTLGGIGQAQAAGTLGATNALAGGVTGGTNAYTNTLLLSKLFGNGGNASFGGESPLTGIYGGSSANPLPGLTAADYGSGY